MQTAPSRIWILVTKSIFYYSNISAMCIAYFYHVVIWINNTTLNWLISLEGGVYANGPGDLGSIPGHIIPKTLKMVLDTSLLNTQQYEVYIKGKVEKSREWSSALLYNSVS